MTASDHDVGDFRSSCKYGVLNFNLHGHLDRTKLVIACGTLSIASLLSIKLCKLIISGLSAS